MFTGAATMYAAGSAIGGALTSALTTIPCCCRGGGGDTFTAAAIVYTLGSVTIPSLASVYNEFALKKHMETSVHEQNFFLYFYGALFNLVGVFGVMAFSHLSWNAIFYGHSKVNSGTLPSCLLMILLTQAMAKLAMCLAPDTYEHDLHVAIQCSLVG